MAAARATTPCASNEIVNSLAAASSGCTSPYPTVVSVITVM